jgi:hypothetical protein
LDKTPKMKKMKLTKLKRETYKLEAVAQDRGFPPLSRTVEVQIDVVDRANNPPVWDQVVYGPIYVKENKNIGDKVVSVKARSVLPSIGNDMKK